MISVLVALIACGGPTPASIKLDGDQAKIVHSTDAVAVNAATVLDAEGAALAEQPAVTWTVTPETVAKLDGSNIVPVGNGDATITAAVGDIKSEYHVMVALPDSVAITGYTPGDAWPMGESKTLMGAVNSGGTAIEGMAVTWASDNAAVATVDDKGMVMGVSEGTANITATSGALSAVVSVTIQPAAPATADAAAAPH
jgi:hypothetical protein